MACEPVPILILVILMTGLYVKAQQENISNVCDHFQCNNNEVCRVVQECMILDCFSLPVCLPCVPEDADKECNYYGWLYAVLYGSLNNYESLQALPCGGNVCPAGSTCIASRLYDTHGICCYGGKYETPVANRDPKCTPCDPECHNGYSCHQVSGECHNVRYGCRPNRKAGICPGAPEESTTCPSKAPPSCANDQECPDSQKCCLAACGVKACTEPIMV